jgi:NhaP-type Na+/H+ or K+/H+ antiporter
VNEPGGALMGVASVALARRFGLPGIIAAAAGGYALKRYSERRRGATPRAQ